MDRQAQLIWPAAFGGTYSHGGDGVVITVGAHDENFAITKFSRRGKSYVDLLAPGCRVPTYAGTISGDQKPAVIPTEVNGTSFAAPLVSFVAALLKNEGLTNRDIKTRLIKSVDVRSELKETVYSSGTLNIPKALAVYHDVIEFARYTEGAERPTIERRFGRN